MSPQQMKKKSRWEQLLDDVLNLEREDLYNFSVKYSYKLKMKLNGADKK